MAGSSLFRRVNNGFRTGIEPPGDFDNFSKGVDPGSSEGRVRDGETLRWFGGDEAEDNIENALDGKRSVGEYASRPLIVDVDNAVVSVFD